MIAEQPNPAAEAPAEPVRPQVETVIARETPNPRWSTHHLRRLLTVGKKPVFGPDDTVFTIGSCFAERIRLVLQEEGVKVGPPYGEIAIDPDRYQIDTLPKRPHMNYYNSFTIRQEFERHIGEWTQSPDDYWTLKDAIWGGTHAYQDPYRRLVYGRTPEDLQEAVGRVNAIMDKGIRSSTVFFITLGMAEVFRNKKTGLIACQKPMYGGGAGADETEFHMSSYEENFANMDRVVEIIRQVRPDARIIVTVSPVGLGRTFSDQDIIVANTEGKAILRAVLGALARKHDNVTYFPSFEIAMGGGPAAFYEKDGRHVNPWVVQRIVKAFMSAHYAAPQAEEAPPLAQAG